MKLDVAPLLRWVSSPPADRSDARAWHRARTQGWITEDCADRLLLRYANIQYELVYDLAEHGPEQNDRAATTGTEPEVRPLGRSTR